MSVCVCVPHLNFPWNQGGCCQVIISLLRFRTSTNNISKSLHTLLKSELRTFLRKSLYHINNDLKLILLIYGKIYKMHTCCDTYWPQEIYYYGPSCSESPDFIAIYSQYMSFGTFPCLKAEKNEKSEKHSWSAYWNKVLINLSWTLFSLANGERSTGRKQPT